MTPQVRGMPDACERFCRGCGYPLIHLTVNRCPECGLAFDPLNSATFVDREWKCLRRRRIWVRVLVASVALTVVVCSIYAAMRLCEKRQAVLFCKECGARFDRDEYRIGDIRVFCRTHGIRQTHISRFLRAPEHVHKWAPCAERRYGLSGKQRFPQARPHPGMVLCLDTAYAGEKLPLLARHVPDLAARIRRDILNGNGSRAAACAVLLKDMCGDPCSSNVKRCMRLWGLVREP
jgi:hypothetical protein